MLDRIVMYLVQARYYLESSLAISMGIFVVALLLMWIISRYGLKRKMKISIKNMIITYLLLLYIIVILKITGILGMSFKIAWFLDAIKYCEIRIPFVGSSILMVTLNLLLFVPWGFLITAVFKKINFNFYNNQDLLLENINHIIYSLKDGTVYLSREGDENFTTVLKYENKEYPFIMNEDVYEMMDTLY